MVANGNIIWFEIPADDLNRAKRFYGELFGWKINAMPGAPGNYHQIDTGGPDASPDGGLMERQNPGQRGITSYITVESVEASAAKVQALGGTVCLPKTPIPGKGAFAICMDTEQNMFGLWECDKDLK